MEILANLRFYALRKKNHILNSMVIGGVELMHECRPQHLRMETARVYLNEPEIQNTGYGKK